MGDRCIVLLTPRFVDARVVIGVLARDGGAGRDRDEAREFTSHAEAQAWVDRGIPAGFLATIVAADGAGVGPLPGAGEAARPDTAPDEPGCPGRGDCG